jgi:hypothetical protein
MNEAVQIRSFRHPDDYGAVIDLWGRSGPGLHIGHSDTFDEITKKLNRILIYSLSLNARAKLLVL